jgi:antitoxin MazE
MKARIVRIGNSRGVRIPKALLDQAGLKEHVEIEAKKGLLIIKPAKSARAGWHEAFARMAERGDDAPLLDEGAGPAWDEEESQW